MRWPRRRLTPGPPSSVFWWLRGSQPAGRSVVLHIDGAGVGRRKGPCGADGPDPAVGSVVAGLDTVPVEQQGDLAGDRVPGTGRRPVNITDSDKIAGPQDRDIAVDGAGAHQDPAWLGRQDGSGNGAEKEEAGALPHDDAATRGTSRCEAQAPAPGNGDQAGDDA